MYRSFATLFTIILALGATSAELAAAPEPSATIPWKDLAAKAESQYQGDGLAVTADDAGARLRCVFQRIEGLVSSDGLWILSTEDGAPRDRFQLVAREVGRVDEPSALWLAATGGVAVANARASFIRPEVVEEYSVSADGIRQDFLVQERPPGHGALRVGLGLAGARAESAAYGARLVLDGSGRELAYSALRVFDAEGRALEARLEVISPTALAVIVDDASAVYPVRIDPTISDANWLSMGTFPAFDRAVLAIAVDGSGNLYVAGDFTSVGNLVTNRIAKWNGSAWSPLGTGLNGLVYTLAISGTDVYAGGLFTEAGGASANRIAKWNGSAWSALGAGMNDNVQSLAFLGTDLYAGGLFTLAGGASAAHVAKWNGSAWSALGTGTSSSVYALAVSGTDLFAGGLFTVAGGVSANRIAKWDGSAWSALGSGLSSSVWTLKASGSDLYVGGAFTSAGGTPANRIAKWNGSAWSALGTGASNEVHSLAVLGTDLYVGGDFISAGGVGAVRIAKWDGSAWSALHTGASDRVAALAVVGTDLYVGGYFIVAGGSSAYRFARWDGNLWATVGPQVGSGLNGYVNAVAVSGTDVYVGGSFTMAGAISASRVAKWNGSSWSALGTGMTGGTGAEVNALAMVGTDLYAAGSFTAAGGGSASNIARWNGSAWSALGTGTSGTILALAASGTDLYAAGVFSTAGGGSASRIAKWNGSAWSALGTGLSGQVNAIAASGSDVYATGIFNMAGGNSAARIAKWDGSAWSAMGTGIGGAGGGFALAVSGTDVYLGGGFNSVGGVSASNIAKWNGSAWSALGTGTASGEVRALLVAGSDLYVGGYFPSAGGVSASSIARWNGSSWSALGSGVNPGVLALAKSGSNLWVGGWFTTAGSKMSAFAARVIVPPTPEVQSIVDVGNDQGGWVRLGFTRSEFDRAGETEFPVTGYQILHRIDASAPESQIRPYGVRPAGAISSLRRTWGGRQALVPERLEAAVIDPGTWETVGWVAATQSDDYSVLVPTTADSTASGIAWSVYLITAHTTTPSVWFGSDPDSGYSVDNLLPNVPTGFVASYESGSGNHLTWDDPVDEDFRYFKIYRSTDPDFIPGPSNLVHQTTTTDWIDDSFGGGTVYYKLAAVDFSDNESAPASANVTVGAGGLDIPLQFALHRIAPNPIRGSAMLQYDVPVGGAGLTLGVYDVEGRLVRALADGGQTPGRKSILWDGRDDAGRILPGGVYLLRMSAVGFHQVRKLTLTR